MRHSARPITATVSAPGYEPGDCTIRYEASGLQERRVALAPLPALPVTLDVWCADGSRCEVPLDVACASAEPDPVRLTTQSLPQGNGRHLARLPAGRWFLRVRRTSDLSNRFAWHGELLETPSPHATRHVPDVTLPASASMTIDVRMPLPVREWTLELRSAEFEGRVRCSGTKATVTGVEVGEWTVTVQPLERSQTVTVTGARDHVLAF